MKTITLEKCKEKFSHYRVAHRVLNSKNIHIINVSKAHTREYMVYWLISDNELDSIHCDNQSQLSKALKILNKKPSGYKDGCVDNYEEFELYSIGQKSEEFKNIFSFKNIVKGNMNSLKSIFKNKYILKNV